MAQWAKYLLWKHEGLGPDAQGPFKTQTGAYCPSVGCRDRWIPETCWPVSLPEIAGLKTDLDSKTKRKQTKWKGDYQVSYKEGNFYKDINHFSFQIHILCTIKCRHLKPSSYYIYI